MSLLAHQGPKAELGEGAREQRKPYHQHQVGHSLLLLENSHPYWLLYLLFLPLWLLLPLALVLPVVVAVG